MPSPTDLPLVLRPATSADIPLLERWDEDPDVIGATSDDGTPDIGFGAYWEEEIARQSEVYQYSIAVLAGRPVGGMLVIDPHLEPTHYWGEIEPNLRAIDIWIGEPDVRGHGVGEAMMRRMLALSFADPTVAAVIIDPLASNVRAHRFYQRLGFVAEGRRTFGDSDCLVHRLTRAAWTSRFPGDTTGAC